MIRSRLKWLFVLAALGNGVIAGSLDDFSNNLATDLGPLVQLFGEAVTIQYLSEATEFVDYLYVHQEINPPIPQVDCLILQTQQAYLRWHQSVS